MKKMQCEVCGSTEIKKIGDNVFECQSCGIQYSKEDIQKLLVEIKTDGSVEVNNSTINIFANQPEDDFIIEDGVLVKYTGNKINVVVPDGVTRIKKDAFLIKQIEKLVFPESVVDVDPGIGRVIMLESLREISFLGVKTLPGYFFTDCKNLRIANLPALEKVSTHMFEGCRNLEEINIPSVSELESFCFSECIKLSNVELSDAVKTIPVRAFDKCWRLTNIIANGVTSIEDSAFRECNRLKSVIFPNVLTIGQSSFYSCISLESVNMPKVKKIGGFSFSSCEKLLSVNFPNLTAWENGMYETFPKWTNVQRIAVSNSQDHSDKELMDEKKYNNTQIEGIDAIDSEKIKALLASGQTIEAIKIYREATGKGLVEAKNAIDKYIEQNKSENNLNNNSANCPKKEVSNQTNNTGSANDGRNWSTVIAIAVFVIFFLLLFGKYLF